jgi:dCMP deaminase
LISSIYKNRRNFILIGLTGRIGSGCTTAAKFLSQKKEDHRLKNISIDDLSNDKTRKKFILDKFYKENWEPFTTIKASDIIITYILKYNFDDFNNILKDFDNNVINSQRKEDVQREPLDQRLRFYGKIIELEQTFKDKYNLAHEKFKDILTNENMKCDSTKMNKLFILITKDLAEFSLAIRQILSKTSYKNFTDIFQLLGDNIRLYGDIKLNESDKSAKNIYKISEAIDLFIDIIKFNNIEKGLPTLITIDAIRNSLEAMYFKEKYSSFYLLAISADDDDVENRLLSNQMTQSEIDKQSKKEHQDKTLDNLENFVSQNIQDCIAKSDIYLVNNGKIDSDNFLELQGQLIKYVSLIMHPGLITPSLDEKMMQIAHTAKLNSGCISRQVGASVTNSNGSLKSVGWNSVAEGQTPCLLRSVDDLECNSKSVAYSSYEQSKTFRTELLKIPKINKGSGLNQSFCFKSVYTNYNPKEKGNQVHTRSLHAEENAFLQLAKYGGEGIKGGTLYTTASPCELCAKKAYQLGIKKIIYIDPYPGIARKQILQTGLFPPVIRLFKGAIGTSYHKLFEQIIPFKDELANLTKLDE